MAYPSLSSGSSPLFYVLIGGGVHIANSRTMARAFNVDLAITRVNGTECDSYELSPNGLPLPPACLDRQAVHSAFVSLEVDMLLDIAHVGEILSDVPDVESLEDKLQSSRLSGSFLYMRHRPRHVIRALRHFFPELEHRYSKALGFSTTVGWSIPRLSATLVFLTVIPDH
eukprot:3231393-Amphidinium_carterae.1